MNATDKEALARAIDSLGATDLGNGYYAYRDEGMQRYYVVTPDALSLLSSYLDRAAELGPSEQYSDGLTCANAYSLWCADTQATEMPSWWTPSRRYACVVNGHYHEGTLAVARHFAADFEREGFTTKVVTVNLETGEEVNAADGKGF